jgi:hypothetical protein
MIDSVGQLMHFGYPRLLNTHRRPYQTKDGYVCVVVYTDTRNAA